MVIPIYCLTFVESDDENRQRLLKLVKIWESNQYLESSIIEQLKNPQISLTNYQQALCNEFGNLVAPLTAGTQAKFNQLQQQHNDFVNHQNSKIQQLQVSTSLPTSLSLPQVVNTSVSQAPFLSANHHSSLQPPPFNQPPSSTVLSMLQSNSQILNAPPPSLPSSIASNVGLTQHLVYVQSQNNVLQAQQPPPQIAPQISTIPNPHIFNPTGQLQPPPNHQLANAHLQIQQPPPQIPPQIPPQLHQPQHSQQPQFAAQQPDVAYFDLPAGLMVPLVKLEDFDYEELNSKDIRLPLPAPPNERLLKAVEEFYVPSTHDKPRNADGWTQLSLYEFYRAKAQAKKESEERMEKLKNYQKRLDDDYKRSRR